MAHLNDLPDGLDLLVGFDILRACLLIVDGPGGSFTLAF